MNYSDTWFSTQPMTMYASGICFGREYWLHQYVEVLSGELVPMHEENADGSIDVLGYGINIFTTLSWGSRNKETMQNSLYKHAEKLRNAGAKIIKQTKNTLIARHGNETAKFVITPIIAETFYSNLNKYKL